MKTESMMATSNVEDQDFCITLPSSGPGLLGRGHPLADSCTGGQLGVQKTACGVELQEGWKSGIGEASVYDWEDPTNPYKER